jgi:uncharacterized membrane protein YoaK (UPF0700 family)
MLNVMAKTTAERDPLIHALTVLTVLSGVSDAISYLGLGHVFTANMTGNVVVIGFALADWPGFSAPASLLSLGMFLCGALGAGRLASTYGGRRRWMLTAVTVEASLAAVCAVISFAHHGISVGAARFAVIALLAFAMGVRNATVRRMAVPDVNTTVLTLTLTGIASDSSLAKGSNPRITRRASAVLAIALGAFLGAVLMRNVNPGWPLLLWCAAATATGLYYVVRSRGQDDEPAAGAGPAEAGAAGAPAPSR